MENSKITINNQGLLVHPPLDGDPEGTEFEIFGGCLGKAVTGGLSRIVPAFLIAGSQISIAKQADLGVRIVKIYKCVIAVDNELDF